MTMIASLQHKIQQIFGRQNKMERIIANEVSENRQTLESLRMYDEGTHEISTDNIKRHLQMLRGSAK